MDTIAKADAVRNCWLLHVDGYEPGDLDQLSDEEIEKLDATIRQADGP